MFPEHNKEPGIFTTHSRTIGKYKRWKTEVKELGNRKEDEAGRNRKEREIIEEGKELKKEKRK